MEHDERDPDTTDGTRGAWRVVGVAAGALGFALMATPVFAGPPAEQGDEATAPTAAPESAEQPEAAQDAEEVSRETEAQVVTVPEAEASRQRLEAGMADLGALSREARSSGDMIRTSCVEDRRKRAQEVMKLATDEVLIIRDPKTDAQARTFAQEKLAAAADRLDDMVAEARNCGADASPEDEDDRTRTEADEPKTIPPNNPTDGLGEKPVPIAVTNEWPFVASPTA